MNKDILNEEIQDFIFNYSEDLTKLAFSGSPFKSISTQELLEQIESRKKIKKKLPTWFQTKNVFYPPKLNLEQTSSEITARYKANLFKGKLMADLTGGFGIDSFYFSKNFNKVHHFEQNKKLSSIANHNFKQLRIDNILCKIGNGLDLLVDKYDLVYVDPSRRNDVKGKVFYLKDCEPNIPKNLNKLWKHSNRILIKSSPMLDITVGLDELDGVKEVHIIAIKNEVKELLFLLEHHFVDNPIIKTIHFNTNSIQLFNFEWKQEAQSKYDYPKKYLYEPNSAILKSGAFHLIAENYKILKLEQHSHLYTSNELIEFPGRRFQINKVIPYQKKKLKFIKNTKANISARNFPETVSQIQKKLKISDGGDTYLFFTSTIDNSKIVLVCSKV